MKKILLTAIGASLLVSSIGSTYAISDSTSSTENTVYQQTKSSEMRLEYYNKYKAKGYDVSSLAAYLDGAKTTESQFWEALKQVQNNHEVPQRRAYVEKLKSYGYDVSGFTEEIIWDSGKFWEMYKAVEAGKKVVTEVKKETEKKVEAKKEEVKAKVEEKKTEVAKISATQAEKLKLLMKARIAKLPADSRDATLVRLESALTKAISSAQTKNAKMLAARYEVLLAVVQEEMNSVDDESLINSLFQ